MEAGFTPAIVTILGAVSALGVLTISLFTWLHIDIRDLRKELSNLRDRVSSIEGFLKAMFPERTVETAALQEPEDDEPRDGR